MEKAPARLLLRVPTERWISLPVPRQACLGLARAVVFVARQLAQGPPMGAGEAKASEGWRDTCWRLAGTSPTVSVWRAAVERGLAAADRTAADQSHQQQLWLEQLRADLVTPNSPQAIGRLRAATPVPEAVLDRLMQGHRAESADLFCGVGSRGGAGDWLETLAIWSVQQEAAAAGRPAGEALRGTEADPAAAAIEEALEMATAVAGLASDFGTRVATARLDSIRELAYGAGHEINNPLANIAARAQALLPGEADPERRRRLATIVDQAFRARDMIGGLMIFARPPRPQPAVVPVATLIGNVLESLVSTAEQHGVRLVSSPPPTSLTAVVDGSQVEESLRAVVLNGIEAIAGGGTVTIAAASEDRADGNTCLITVTDNGAGMSRETVERMFDPFFSGREAGRGIGLGLSKALRLIDANGGELRLPRGRGRAPPSR